MGSKPNRKPPNHQRPQDPPGASHMVIWRRLAAVVNMHGTPGQPKRRGGGGK
jgi:hypothetical protein